MVHPAVNAIKTRKMMSLLADTRLMVLVVISILPWLATKHRQRLLFNAVSYMLELLFFSEENLRIEVLSWNVGFGSVPDYRRSINLMAAFPESGRSDRQKLDKTRCPLSAISGHSSTGTSEAPSPSGTR